MAQSNEGECSIQSKEAKVTRRCPSKDYDFGQLIHEGRFSKLYVVRHATSKEEFVLKTVGFDATDNDCIQFVEELMMLRHVAHPNIIRPVTSWSTGTHVAFLLPLMAYRSCADIVQDNFPSGITESSMGIILSQIIPALEYLHDKKIVHRVIKGSHILVNSHGIAVLSGFKFATIFSVENGVRYEANLTKMAECLNWLSPEVLAQDGGGYTYNTDVYSCGITILELCNGVVPFSDMTPAAMLVQKLKFDTPKLWDKSQLPSSEYPATTSTSTEDMTAIPDQASERNKIYEKKSYSKDFHVFANMCLVADKHTRPNVTQLKRHKFMKAYLTIPPRSLIETLNLTQGLHFQEITGGDQKGGIFEPKESSRDLCTSWIFD